MGRFWPLVLLLAFSATCAADLQSFNFIIQETQVKALCQSRTRLTVNGQFPGPALEVRNGDTVVIKVVNSARNNATIHWHGVRQMLSAWADGPEYVTQCPIRPGGSYTYRFTIQGQEGTLWWHAHSSWMRATVYGAFIIRPAKLKPYPFQKLPAREATILLGEWWEANPFDVVNAAAAIGTTPNVSDAYTINGQPGDLYNCSSSDTTIVPVAAGETTLLRIVNSALNQDLFFAVANHMLTVVSVDAIYVKPFVTATVVISPGQTTDVLLTANQPPGRYYIAAAPFVTAQNAPFNNSTTTAILEYKSAPCPAPCSAGKNGSLPRPAFPSMPAFNDTRPEAAFANSLKGQASGAVPRSVDVSLLVTVGLGLLDCPQGQTCAGPNGKRLAASMNNASFVLPRRNSILQAHISGNAAGIFTSDFPQNPPLPFDYTSNVSQSLWQTTQGTKTFPVKYGSAVQIVLQGTSIIGPENHPLHLHGYDFYVVGRGSGNFNPNTDTANFNLVDPPQRNTVAVPSAGWVAIRFFADNPGTWLMHCHLDVHLGWGLGTVIIVQNGNGPNQSLGPPPNDIPSC